ncbi:MAG: PEP-CTERM sorting domain-containing protein [Pirellulales bacterium]|nr:PEP-CTERM sorting domain-containing protein [Pirellulales bacterium]
MRIRQLINRAAFCALASCVFLMSGIANLSFGGLINDPASNYIYEWNEFFTSTRPSTAGLTFGTPQVLSGNVLDFANNLQFSSVSGGATPSDFVDGKLVLDIQAKPNFAIGSVTLFERGTYSFGFGGTSTTGAQVQLLGATLNITEIDGVPVSGANYPGIMNFNVPPPTQAGSKTFLKTVDPDAGNWAGDMTISLAAFYSDPANQGKNVTGVKLIFNNQLETAVGTSTHSFIDKKDVRISVGPLTIPEPSSFVLLGMGALLFVLVRKRK